VRRGFAAFERFTARAAAPPPSLLIPHARRLRWRRSGGAPGTRQLRHPLGRHEGGGLDEAQPRGREAVDQLQFRGRRYHARLVLQPVAGAHLVQRHRRRQRPALELRAGGGGWGSSGAAMGAQRRRQPGAIPGAARPQSRRGRGRERTLMVEARRRRRPPPAREQAGPPSAATAAPSMDWGRLPADAARASALRRRRGDIVGSAVHSGARNGVGGGGRVSGASPAAAPGRRRHSRRRRRRRRGGRQCRWLLAMFCRRLRRPRRARGASLGARRRLRFSPRIITPLRLPPSLLTTGRLPSPRCTHS